MAFFNRIKKTMLVTFILTALMTLSANAYDVKGGEIKVGSSLNLRSEANTSASVVTQIPNTHRVAVLDAIEGWYKVAYNGQSGYVSADYLRFGEAAAQSAATPVPTATPQMGAYRVVVESDNGLNLRAAPHTGSQVVYVLPYGMVLTVLGESENGFLHVQWAGYTGYVSSQYVSPLGAQ